MDAPPRLLHVTCCTGWGHGTPSVRSVNPLRSVCIRHDDFSRPKLSITDKPLLASRFFRFFFLGFLGRELDDVGIGRKLSDVGRGRLVCVRQSSIRAQATKDKGTVSYYIEYLEIRPWHCTESSVSECCIGLIRLWVRCCCCAECWEKCVRLCVWLFLVL